MPGYLVDTNVWIAFNFEGHPLNSDAVTFLGGCSAERPVFFSRAIENSTLRLLSTPALCRAYGAPPLTNHQAVTILTDWRSQGGVFCLDSEPEGTRELWLELAATPTASPKVWMDAYLAAFAICADIPFVTLDADFRRFEAAGLNLLLLVA